MKKEQNHVGMEKSANMSLPEDAAVKAKLQIEFATMICKKVEDAPERYRKQVEENLKTQDSVQISIMETYIECTRPDGTTFFIDTDENYDPYEYAHFGTAGAILVELDSMMRDERNPLLEKASDMAVKKLSAASDLNDMLVAKSAIVNSDLSKKEQTEELMKIAQHFVKKICGEHDVDLGDISKLLEDFTNMEVGGQC